MSTRTLLLAIAAMLAFIIGHSLATPAGDHIQITGNHNTVLTQ